MNNKEKIIAIASLLNIASKIFKMKSSEVKDILSSMKGLSKLLDPRIEELLETAYSKLLEKPEAVDEVNTRIEMGAVSPYAADYIALNDDRRIYVKVEVGEYYKLHGVKVRGEMPDHIAPMLELLSLLLIKRVYLEERGDTMGVKRCMEDLEKLYAGYVKPTLEGLISNLGVETPHRYILEGVMMALDSLQANS